MKVSYACRTCCWGDWGDSMPPCCPWCRGPLHTTGRVRVLDVKSLASAQPARQDS